MAERCLEIWDFHPALKRSRMDPSFLWEALWCAHRTESSRQTCEEQREELLNAKLRLLLCLFLLPIKTKSCQQPSEEGTHCMSQTKHYAHLNLERSTQECHDVAEPKTPRLLFHMWHELWLLRRCLWHSHQQGRVCRPKGNWNVITCGGLGESHRCKPSPAHSPELGQPAQGGLAPCRTAAVPSWMVCSFRSSCTFTGSSEIGWNLVKITFFIAEKQNPKHSLVFQTTSILSENTNVCCSRDKSCHKC